MRCGQEDLENLSLSKKHHAQRWDGGIPAVRWLTLTLTQGAEMRDVCTHVIKALHRASSAWIDVGPWHQRVLNWLDRLEPSPDEQCKHDETAAQAAYER